MSKKILYISSADPLKGPGTIALDHYKALVKAGFDITFLTTYPVAGHDYIKYVLEKPYSRRYDLIRRFPYHQLRRKRNPEKYSEYYYFYRKENEPPIKIKSVLNKIDNDYDAIIVFYWQGLLTYKTLYKIFTKQKKQPKVIFVAADYSTMTGGCHFFGDCNGYTKGCGNCPMIASHNPNDFTKWNMTYRKKIIDKLKPTIILNSYMKSFFQNSEVIKAGANLKTLGIILDLDKFRHLNRNEALTKYNIDTEDFVILFGAQNMDDERKGMKYLIDSLSILYSNLDEEDRGKISLVIIGNGDKIKNLLPPFKQIYLGYVNIDDLPEIYSMANVYISPSINDAGPSMVNQALACATPVISFEMGSALDVIKNQDSGICVEIKNTEALANAIETTYHLNEEEYKKMKEKARQSAMKYNSYKSFTDTIKEILNN